MIVNVGALIIRIGFWGTLYHNYNMELPKRVLGNNEGSSLN